MARRVVKEYVEDTPNASSVPENAVALDPDGNRMRELQGDLGEDEIEELFRVSDELRATQGVRLQFVRILPAVPGKTGYVGEMSPAEFTLERVRSQFGVGKYRVRCMGPKGYVPGGGSVEIAETVSGSSSTATPLNFNELFQNYEQRAEQRRLDEASRRREDQRFYLQLLAPLAATALPLLFQRTSINDVVTAAAGLKQLAPPPESSAMEKTIDALLKGLELGRGMNGGEDTWISIVRDLAKDALPTVKPVLEGLATKLQNRAPVTATAIPRPTSPPPVALPSVVTSGLPASVPVPATASGTTAAGPVSSSGLGSATGLTGSDSTEIDMFDQFVKPMLQRRVIELQEFAEASAPADLTAEALLAKIPRLMRSQVTPQQVKEWLMRPDWWGLLSQFHPPLGPYQAYCDDVRVELIRMMDEEIQPSGSTDDTESAA